MKVWSGSIYFLSSPHQPFVKLGGVGLFKPLSSHMVTYLCVDARIQLCDSLIRSSKGPGGSCKLVCVSFFLCGIKSCFRCFIRSSFVSGCQNRNKKLLGAPGLTTRSMKLIGTRSYLGSHLLVEADCRWFRDCNCTPGVGRFGSAAFGPQRGCWAASCWIRSFGIGDSGMWGACSVRFCCLKQPLEPLVASFAPSSDALCS